MADRIESMFRVDGRRALVTGASSGLGRRFARTLAPGFSSTNASGVSPHFGCGLATTAQAITAGWRYSASSTSSELMFSPPEMMMSLLRSLILT